MKKQSKISFFLVFIILILVGYIVYTHLPKNDTEVTAPAPTATTTTVKTTSVVKSAVSDWKNYSDGYGFTLMYPSYATIDPDSKANNLDKNPTALSYHAVEFTPDPNADFSTFSAVVEVDAAKDFILDLPDRFIVFNVGTSAWYSNENLDDKPSYKHLTYQNLYLPNNQFSPPIYGHTKTGLYIYGPFLLGDTSRGTASYLIPIVSKNIIVDIKYTYNADALSGSSQAVKNLKAQFDKDLPTILKSIASN